MRLLACLIVAPQRGYDEPAILSYAISSFCPTSADGLQVRDGNQSQDRRGARHQNLRQSTLARRRGDRVRRREFITLLSGAAAWPLTARGQQSIGQPLVGLLSPLSAAAWVHILGAFRRGMRDLGYVEGANVAFAFRFADGQVAKLAALPNDVVALKPGVH